MKNPLSKSAVVAPTPSDAVGLTPGPPPTEAAANPIAGAVRAWRRRGPSLGVGAAARKSLSRVGHHAGDAMTHLPRVLHATDARARLAVEALKTMPDETLQSLAAASVGLGAGLSFTRAGRLGALVGAVPAVVIGTVLITRPTAADDGARTTG